METSPSQMQPVVSAAAAAGNNNGAANNSIYAKAQEALRAHYQHMGLIMLWIVEFFHSPAFFIFKPLFISESVAKSTIVT